MCTCDNTKLTNGQLAVIISEEQDRIARDVLNNDMAASAGAKAVENLIKTTLHQPQDLASIYATAMSNKDNSDFYLEVEKLIKESLTKEKTNLLSGLFK